MSDRGAATCPHCGSTDTKVTNTEHQGSGKTLRRHLCRNTRCTGRTFTTVEEHAVRVNAWLRASAWVDEP